MPYDILICDENPVMHGLLSSSLEGMGANLHHEFLKERFEQRALEIVPTLFIFGDSDTDSAFELSAPFRNDSRLSHIPQLLVVGDTPENTAENTSNQLIFLEEPINSNMLKAAIKKMLDTTEHTGENTHRSGWNASTLEDTLMTDDALQQALQVEPVQGVLPDGSTIRTPTPAPVIESTDEELAEYDELDQSDVIQSSWSEDRNLSMQPDSLPPVFESWEQPAASPIESNPFITGQNTHSSEIDTDTPTHQPPAQKEEIVNDFASMYESISEETDHSASAPSSEPAAEQPSNFNELNDLNKMRSSVNLSESYFSSEESIPPTSAALKTPQRRLTDEFNEDYLMDKDSSRSVSNRSPSPQPAVDWEQISQEVTSAMLPKLRMLLEEEVARAIEKNKA